MPQALIQFNAVTGSNPPNGTPIVCGASVACTNVNLGGEVTYLWEFLDRPEGSSAAFSNPAITNPTFIADVEGTYVVRLTVNATLASEAIDTRILAVLQVKTGIRIPGAYETTQESLTRGWAQAVNRTHRVLDALRADPGYMTGYAVAGMSRGELAYISGVRTLLAGLPGEQTIVKFSPALATSAAAMDLPLFVVQGSLTGGTTIAITALGYFRAWGLVGPLALGAGSAGDPVYATDAGGVSTTPGTISRRVGSIVAINGADYWIHFDGGLGHHEGLLELNRTGTIRVGDDLAVDVPDASEIKLVFGGAQYWGFDKTAFFSVGGDLPIQGVLDPVSAQDAATKAYVDATATAASHQTYYFGNLNTPATATQVSLDPGFGTRTAPSAAGGHPAIPMPLAGVISKLYVTASTGPVGAGLDVTVYIGAGASALTCNLASGGVLALDTLHTDTVVVGDLVTIQVKGDGVLTTGAVDLVACFVFTPS